MGQSERASRSWGVPGAEAAVLAWGREGHWRWALQVA